MKYFYFWFYVEYYIPVLKKEAYESRDKFFEKFDFSLDDVYRALDFFDKYKNDIQEFMWKNTKEKYDRDLSIGLFDCTNYYFEINYNDEDLIKEEEKFDGYYSIVTSELDYSDQKIRQVYRELIKIEDSFKITKSNLEARPVYVWT